MAELLPQLRQSYAETDQAYQQKLNTYANIFRNVKKSQVAKQKFDKEVQRQKDLIQFRSDVQLKQKEQYFKNVTKPQNEAKLQQNQIEQYQNQIRDSYKQAQGKIEDYQKLLDKEDSSNMSRFNMDNFTFMPKPIEENGKLMGYEPATYLKTEDGLQEVGANFRGLRRDRRDFANMLAQVYDSDQQLKSSDNLNGIDTKNPKALIIGNDEKGKEFRRKIRNNPKFRREMIQAYTHDLVHAAGSSEVSSEGGGSKVSKNNVINNITKIHDFFGGENSFKMGFSENTKGGGLAFWDWGSEEHPTGGIIDKNTTVQNIQDQINQTFRVVLPENLAKNFAGVTNLSDGELQIIASGNTDSKELDKLSGDRRDIVETLAGYSEEDRSQLIKLAKLSRTYQQTADEWRQLTGKPAQDNEIMLNPNIDAMDSYNRTNNFKDLFITLDQKGKLEQRAKWGQLLNHYNRDSDVEASFQFSQK